MAINDISLTTGMRSNLLSLQGTVDLLDRTQSRLSSGKKVNTAMDNPVSFFAAQSLNSRASVIDSLKDAMGQAVQTITAADKGITAISAMIEQAKGIAQQALSAETSTGADTYSVALAGIVADDTIDIGDVTFSATSAATPGAQEFVASGNNTIDAYSLAEAVNEYDWSGEAAKFSATVVNGAVVLSSTTTATDAVRDVVAEDISAVTGTGTATETLIAGTSELTNLIAQYNEMRDQIDDLAADSGYKGKNLLNAGTTLTVKFEGTHKLDVAGFDASTGTAGLNITDSALWAQDGKIDAAVVELDAASDTLRAKSSALSGNLSIISVRQNFSTNMINTLTAGADKLTMADTNEEGANMLMLQTRQSLSTTALSMSAQAAQSVLQLFR